MRGLMAATGAVLLGAALLAGWIGCAQAKSTQEYTSGNWTGFSYTDDANGQFTDCTVWVSNRDNIQAGVSVRKDWGLQLWFYSKTWNLPQNQAYPVSYWIDRNGLYRGKVATSGKSTVFIDIDQDNAVFQELKAGSELTVRTSSDDYVFDLSGSRAALAQLVDCVDRNTKAATTNPFGAGSGPDVPQTNSNSQPNNNDNQSNNGGQNNDSQPSNGSGSDDTSMKTPNVSPDEVQKFLVDVTGAKPSMIKVTPRTDKSGTVYYAFSTPLGGGQFWQEKLDGPLKDLAADYVSNYHDDCKGDFEDAPLKPVQGQHGELAAGTASCASSPYQDNNGPEFLSYAMEEDDGVVSIYVTYTGGNAAKAKSDSLGHLIEKHYEEAVQ